MKARAKRLECWGFTTTPQYKEQMEARAKRLGWLMREFMSQFEMSPKKCPNLNDEPVIFSHAKLIWCVYFVLSL